jgi:UDP-4-amino-4,6-dideoxy-N-acetyl-beta-L-altrosamine transaminase
MTISYGRQSISEQDIQAVAAVLETEWLTIGPEVEKFEDAIRIVSQSQHAIAVSSGTAALHCAYAALEIQPGDEVITTPLTFVATAAMANMFGAKIVFADVSAETGNIDPQSVESLITQKTKVVAAVDYAGHPVDLDELSEITQKNGLTLIEDAAHSIGGKYKGKPIGSISDITTFSFFPTKNLTTGEGGAVVSNSNSFAYGARKFKMHGLVREPENMRYPNEGPWHQEVHKFGLNYRLPDILCALGSSQISRLEIFKERRSQIFKTYVEALSEIEWIELPAWKSYVDPMWHLFPIRVPHNIRRDLFEYLRRSGIIVQVNYMPVYWHPVYEDLGYRRGICPVAEDYYSGQISLPIHFELSESNQFKVIDLIKNYKFPRT